MHLPAGPERPRQPAGADVALALDHQVDQLGGVRDRGHRRAALELDETAGKGFDAAERSPSSGRVIVIRRDSVPGGSPTFATCCARSSG